MLFRMAMAVMVAEERGWARDCTYSSIAEIATFSLTVLARSYFRLLVQRSCRASYYAVVREIAVLV